MVNVQTFYPCQESCEQDSEDTTKKLLRTGDKFSFWEPLLIITSRCTRQKKSQQPRQKLAARAEKKNWLLLEKFTNKSLSFEDPFYNRHGEFEVDHGHNLVLCIFWLTMF